MSLISHRTSDHQIDSDSIPFSVRQLQHQQPVDQTNINNLIINNNRNNNINNRNNNINNNNNNILNIGTNTQPRNNEPDIPRVNNLNRNNNINNRNNNINNRNNNINNRNQNNSPNNIGHLLNRNIYRETLVNLADTCQLLQQQFEVQLNDLQEINRNLTHEITHQQQEIADLSNQLVLLEETTTPEKLCSICLTRPRNYANIKCGHLCSCDHCVSHLENKCPICRQNGQFIKIIVS
jgi:hypothetical protein